MKIEWVEDNDLSQLGIPIDYVTTTTENGKRKVSIEFNSEPTTEQLAKLNKALVGLKRDYTTVPFNKSDLPSSDVIGIIKSINVSAARPIVATRTYNGEEFDLNCLVTENIKDQYIAGKIKVGDYVIVTYCTHDYPDQPIVTAKIFKSW